MSTHYSTVIVSRHRKLPQSAITVSFGIRHAIRHGIRIRLAVHIRLAVRIRLAIHIRLAMRIRYHLKRNLEVLKSRKEFRQQLKVRVCDLRSGGLVAEVVTPSFSTRIDSKLGPRMIS